jgi:two-component system sensor histidine kinase UhpB
MIRDDDDIVARTEMDDRHRSEHLKITATAIAAQEKERHAIGIELRDNVNQILASTKLFLSMVKCDPAKDESIINSCIENLQKAIDENRKIAHELIAPDFQTLNFSEQISALTVYMLGASGIAVQIDSCGLREELLDDQQKLAVYRIAQEQCANIVKHSKARLVNISLATADGVFRMIIADNGVGTGTAKKTKGFGLINISSRLSIFNGTVNINTAPRKGFTLEITIPFKK